MTPKAVSWTQLTGYYVWGVSYGIKGHGLVMGLSRSCWWLTLKILKVFHNLSDSVTLWKKQPRTGNASPVLAARRNTRTTTASASLHRCGVLSPTTTHPVPRLRRVPGRGHHGGGSCGMSRCPRPSHSSCGRACSGLAAECQFSLHGALNTRPVVTTCHHSLHKLNFKWQPGD